jgi:DNA-binding response OmpR family regulator
MTETKKKAIAEKHVLVVDDDPEIIDSIQYALKARGFKVSIARDGNQGIAFAETKNPDLLILDMMMPKRSGFLVLERLRQNSEIPVPVIMITGNEGQRHQEYAELLGVSDYIHKPFTMDRLIESVIGLIGSVT